MFSLYDRGGKIIYMQWTCSKNCSTQTVHLWPGDFVWFWSIKIGEIFKSQSFPSSPPYSCSYIYHQHHHHHHPHLPTQVHHGQPGYVHRPADAVQANVCRHRPNWKVIMMNQMTQMTLVTWMTLVITIVSKDDNSEKKARRHTC